MNLECVINVSEGRDGELLERLARACDALLLDLHRDPHHQRSVFTIGGPGDGVEAATSALTTAAVAALDICSHTGEHPRFGVVDVVPFVPLVAAPSVRRRGTGDAVPPPSRPSRPAATPALAVVPELAGAVAARDRFARWAASALDLPCFLYGPLPSGGHRSLPEVRRAAFSGLEPDAGPGRPHPRAGACAAGARPFLVAYNFWLAGGSLGLARSVAGAVRGPAVRSLGFDLGGRFQVSCNLVDPLAIGPGHVHDQVARLLEPEGVSIERCELVGLLPAAVLAAIPSGRWAGLGITPEATVEARLEERGLSPA